MAFLTKRLHCGLGCAAAGNLAAAWTQWCTMDNMGKRFVWGRALDSSRSGSMPLSRESLGVVPQVRNEACGEGSAAIACDRRGPLLLLLL